MSDFGYISEDQKMIAETASQNLFLTSGENPEKVAVGHAMSKKLGIPYTWAKEMDNVDLHPDYSANGLRPKLQAHIAQNIDRAPIYRDHLPALNELVKAIEDAGYDRQAKMEAIRKEYDERGVPYPARIRLANMGYEQLPSGKFSKDGQVVETPVLMGEAVTGEEAKLISNLTRAWKAATGEDVTQWEAFHSLSTAGQKEVLLRNIRHLEKTQAVLNELNGNYPEGWIDRPEKDIKQMVEMIGNRRGIDISDINLKTLRRGGLEEVDYGAMMNVFGARSMIRQFLSVDNETLAKVNSGSLYSDIEDRYRQVREQNTELLGYNLAGKVATGVSHSVPYVLELMATGPVTKVAGAPARAVIGNLLKEGGFTGFAAGARALFTPSGLSSLAKAAGTVLKVEAKRLPFLATGIGAEVRERMNPEPVAFFDEGGVRVDVPEKGVDDLVNVLFNTAFRRYLANVSEWGGELLPSVDLTKLIPSRMLEPWVKNRVVSHFISEVVSSDPTKSKILKDAFLGGAPISGLFGEMAEEYINKGFERASTILSEATGVEALDMGTDAVFEGMEESVVIAAVALVQSSMGKAARIPSAINHSMKLTRFVDSHRNLVEQLSKVSKELPGGAEETRHLLDRMLGESEDLLIDPEDAETLFQKNPEFAVKIGMTADRIAEASQKGELVSISHNDLLMEQATNPANNEIAEELLTTIQSGGTTVGEALDPKSASELVETYKAETDRVKELRMKVYAAIQEPSETAGVSKEAQKSFSMIGGFLLNYLDKHSLEDGKIEEAWDKLVVNFRENPESFVAPTDLLQSVYHGTPYVWEPEPGFPHGRPRLDKMGTGEGAQAYGWGWYSAESRGVAKSYVPDSFQDRVERVLVPKLFRDPAVSQVFEEFKVPSGALLDLVSAIDSGVYKGRGDTISTILRFDAAEIRQKYDEDGERIDRVLDRKEAYAVWEQIYDAASRIAESTPKGSGSLYKLDIPDEAIPNMLLWDERMDNQTPGVLQILGEIAQDTELAERVGAEGVYIGTDETVEEFYEDLSNLLGSPKAASGYLNSMGISGVKYKDGMSRDEGKEAPTYNYVIWDQDTLNKVALLERNGEKLQAIQDAQNTLYQSASESPALDAEYMKAVESGDMETAQRMVTEAAERAGYDVGYLVYRGDSEPRNVLKTGMELDDENGVDRDYYDVGNLGNGIYLTPSRMYARTFGKVIQKFYLKVNAIDVASEEIKNAIAEIMEEDTGGLNKEDIARELRNRFSANAIKGEGVGGLSYGAEEIAIQESNLAKLADPVTYDDNGNPIPLSQRFNLNVPDVRYQSISKSSAPDAEYMKAVESGDMETAQRMVTEAAERAGVPIIDDSESTSYRVRRTAPPKKTVKAYKLFRTVASRPGELFPLFVGADSSVPIGVWLDAIPGPEAPDSKTGRQKVKSKLGALAYRPGWHSGDAPLAAHIGVKDAEGNVYARRDTEVWAEVEMAADVDYQPEADKNGVNEKGVFRGANADIKHMPTDGFYRYKTNPNMMGKWIISGSMKINRIMSEVEVNEELKRQGLTPMPWENGPLNLKGKGLSTDAVRSEDTGKVLDPVTYDDEGNVIPLSQRFNSSIPDARYQKPGDLYRGSFTPAQDFNLSFNAVVSLFKSANASTLPHEASHWVKRMMKAMIDGGWADTALIQDHEAIEKWLDRQTYESQEGTTERNRERDEKFASAFEEYIRKGEAPNSLIESAFNTLKKFLTSIYKYVRGALLDVTMDEEIVSVFNRMLSTETLVERDAPLREAIDTLKATYVELLGVSQDEAKDFQKLIRDAIAQMENSIDGRKIRRLNTLKKTWRGEAQALMDDSPVYKAWEKIRKGGGLDTDFVEKVAGYGKEIGSFLRKRGLMAKVKETGIDVPLLAKEAGYASVDAFLGELIDAQTPTEFMASYVAAKEAEFNANFQLEGDDLSTKASIDLLDKVAEQLENKSGIRGYREKFNAFRDKVREHINTLSVAELQTDTRLVSSLKNSQKRLVKAITKKDYESSLKLLTGMRWNIQSLKERASARKEIVKTESLFRRIRNMKAGVILGDYHDALRELAYYFGFSKKKLKKVDENFRSIIGRKADEVGDAFGPFLWPEFLLRENVESYRKLTFAEFQDLRDFTKYIEGEGRDLVEAQKGTFANKVKAWIERALEVFSTQPEKYDNRKSERNRIASAARYGFNWGLNLRTFLGKADGFQHMGKDGEEGPNLALRSHLLEGFRRMIGLETTAKQQINPAAIALKATADAMDVKTGLPEFKKNTLHGYSEWTPEMVISACLNMGTESGRQRLMDGYGWDDADLGMIAKKLTASDLNHIQGIWDTLSGELWRATAQTFLEENHFRLDEIPARALTVTSSDGQVVSLRGGYYPIVYAHHSRTREVPMGFDPRALYSEVSATHRRREMIKEPDPVKLSLSVLESHIHSTAQYAALRMPVRMVLRVVMSKEYSDAFIKTQSPEAYENVLSIFKNIANPNPSTEKIMNGFEGWARSVLTATALMGNLKAAATQLSSVTVGMGELGHYYADALTEFASDPIGTWKTVLTNSAMIRHRAEYYDIDLRASLDAISENGLEKARRKFAKAGYMLMRGADQMVAVVSWRAKYLQAEDQLGQKGGKDAFLKAVAQADDFVARTQGAARTLDLTPIQLTSIGRMVSPFITSVGAQYNTVLESLGAVREGRLSVSEAIGALTGNLIAPVLFQAVLSYIVFGGLFGDDDDDIDRANKMFVKELLTSPFAGIPIVRDVTGLTGEVIASRMTGAKRNAYGFNVLDAGAVNAAGDIIGDLVKGTEEAYEGNAKRSFYLIAKSLGASSGMPVIHIYEKLIRVYKNNGGELPDSWEEFHQRSKEK